MYDVCTSKSENCDSNLSITSEICAPSRIYLAIFFFTGGRGGETGTNAFEVHGFHRFVHAFDDARHVPCHLSHRSSRLHSARYGVNTAGESEQVERFALFADRIGGVYPCAVVVALLQRLWLTVGLVCKPFYSHLGGEEGGAR